MVVRDYDFINFLLIRVHEIRYYMSPNICK